MASPVQAATQAGSAVKIEPYDGHHCLSCLGSARPGLKEAKASDNDGNDGAVPPVHPWSPWTQAGPVGGAIAVPENGPDADPDQKEGGQSVPVRGGKAAAGGKQAARKTVKFLPFAEALSYVRCLRLKNQNEWKVWCKSGVRLGKMPSSPHRTYKHEGWQGYGHWLGTGNIQNGKQQYLPFAVALPYARSLRLKNQKE